MGVTGGPEGLAPDQCRATAQRLAAVAQVVTPGVGGPPAVGPAPGWAAAGTLLEGLVAAAQASADADTVWLLYVGLATVMPDQDAVRRVLRVLRTRSTGDATRWLLATCLQEAHTSGDVLATLTVRVGDVLVDVDFSAQNDLHTGIQRVVRSLLPRWNRDHRLTPVVWTRSHSCLRELTGAESDRVLRWSGDPLDRMHAATATAGRDLVVPWRSVLVLPEVPPTQACARLAALARFSGNAVVGIGYDCIPLTSANLLPRAEPERFTRYLGVVKHMQRLACISAAAAGEFGGVVAMLPSQGITGPVVSAVPLPEDAPQQPAPAAPSPPGAAPLVLCVGSFDPRKNALAVLYAAERLWREDRTFRLQFVSGGGPGGEGERRMRELARAGRPVAGARAVSEADLHAAYRAARFTVFVSLHEGYGLPVAESLAHGVPVITTSYGSTAELAAGGGVLTVDPRDDEALVAAFRDLLTDDGLLERLRAQIPTRPRRSWDDYAAELWDGLVGAEPPPAPAGAEPHPAPAAAELWDGLVGAEPHPAPAGAEPGSGRAAP